MSDWKKKCEDKWSLQAAPMPDSLDWHSIYAAMPLSRNLLKNPSPYGLSKDVPPPDPELAETPPHGPPGFAPDDNAFCGYFSGWTTNAEVLPDDMSGTPPGVTVSHMPQFRWFSMEQIVDLKAERLWEELLDDFQPEIVINDWYEESKVHDFIYELHVKLLDVDKSTVIAEHSVSPKEDLGSYSHTWKEVSHVFSGYGPGVRYVHFTHRLKSSCLMNKFSFTKFTGSSVIVNPVRTSS